MLDLELSLVGWWHTIASVLAMVAFVPLMIARCASNREDGGTSI